MKRSEAIRNKIFDITTLLHMISVWRFKNKKIVFTNGCFDIIHTGHIYLLNQAADADQHCMVIVGLNSDDSVRQLKGNGRPVNKYEDREWVLANLYAVDAVIGFNESTPIELIKKIQPDYLVKGGDYKEDEIVGAAFVKGYGGKVMIVPYLENYSTSKLISKLAN